MKNPTKYIGNEETYIKQVLNSENWSATSGSWTNTLEVEFAKRFGTKYAVAFNSGTSTLHAALLAAGVKSGDEVISPALTVIMDTTATFHANAIPVYADVDKDTYLIDVEDVKRKITPKTKAIIPVTLYGLSMDMTELKAVADERNIAIIEDNAQCLSNKFQGSIASYSFENTKHISCGEGGMIVTNDEHYAELARKIGGHGFKNLKATEGRVRLRDDIFQDPNYKRHDVLGWNYRLSEFSSAIALAQLECVDELISMRIQNAELFMDVMNDCDYLTPQKCPTGQTNTYYTLGVIYNGEEQIGVSWQDFRNKYKEISGQGFYGCWSVPYLEPMMTNRTFVSHNPELYKNLVYKKGICPVAEQVQPKLMQFKTNYRELELTKEHAKGLKETIRWFKKCL